MEDLLLLRRKYEQEIFKNLVPPTSVELKTKYFLNKTWKEKWKMYIEDFNESSPGPINNKDLIEGKRDS
jgi:hypothetical protein